MKGILLKSVAVLMSISVISLVGCSASNTRDQNAAIGGVTGAVIGGAAGSLVGAGSGQVAAIAGGAIIGGLIGAGIGYEMDSSDTAHYYTVMDHNATNHSAHWVNRHTGNKYVVTPMSGRMKMKGYAVCRKFSTTAIIKGKKQRVYGVACRQKNGVWKAV